eukprot:g4089.t1
MDEKTNDSTSAFILTTRFGCTVGGEGDDVIRGGALRRRGVERGGPSRMNEVHKEILMKRKMQDSYHRESRSEKKHRTNFRLKKAHIADMIEKEKKRQMFPPPPNVNPFFAQRHVNEEETSCAAHDKRNRSSSKEEDGKDDALSTSMTMMVSSPPKRGLALQQVKPFWCNSNSNSPTPSPRRSGATPSFSRYLQDYQEIGCIGTGSFGVVTKCRSRLDGCTYAIKKVTLRKRKTCGGGKYELPKEIFALSSLEANPHITRYYSSWIEDGSAYLVLELCEESLQKYVDGPKSERLDEQQLLEILRQTLEGLRHLHRHSVVHMDIKPGNVLVKRDLVGETFLLGDFGLATLSKERMHVQEGDTRFMAPEMLQENPRMLEQADIFSLGATILSLALGCDLPQSGRGWRDLREGKLPALAGHFSVEFADLIHAMMHPNPSLRPTAASLLKRPLLQDETHRALACLQRELNWLQRKNPNVAHLKPAGLTRRFTF